MKSITILLPALLAISEAASVQKCAGSCALKGIEATGCSSIDSSCICSSEAFLSTVNECVPETCSEEEKEDALTYAQDFCRKIDLAKRDAEPAAWGPEGGWDEGDHHEGWGGWGGWWGEGDHKGWWDWWRKHPKEWRKHHWPKPPPTKHHKPPPTHAHHHPKPTNTVWPPPPPEHKGHHWGWGGEHGWEGEHRWGGEHGWGGHWP